MWQKIMLYRPLLFLSLILGFAISVTPIRHSYANPATPERASYQASILTETLDHINLSTKSYIITDTATPLPIATVIDQIRNGNALYNMNHSDIIRVAQNNKGIWIVFPIVNQSSRDIWTLDLGSFINGRFSDFQTVAIYNLNTNQYLINTDDSISKNQNLPSLLHIKIPSGQTSFYILHLKPSTGIPLFLKPSLSPANQNGFMETFLSFLSGILGFSAFLYFIKKSQNSLSKPHFFIGCMWLFATISMMLPSHFLRFGILDSQFLIPVIWMSMLFMAILSLISRKESRESIPLSLFGGLTSIFLISGIAGLVLLNMMPTVAIGLIYVPIFLGYTLITIACATMNQNGKLHFYLPLGIPSLLISLLLLWVGLMEINIIPATSFTVSIPYSLTIFAITFSILGTVIEDFFQSNGSKTNTTQNVFSENQLQKNELLQIFEAKEQSEHRRLIQVIEQERKLMSELQLKTAIQNENMRKSKETADEANRAKSAFLAIVSHEIRTPMTGIMGMLRLLQDTQLSKEQKEYTTTIKDSGDAMLALLNDILDFEKIESGKMDLEQISFDLKRLVKGIHTLMRGHAEAKNIDIILEIDATTPTWVRGDPTRLRQVLLNLINNAIKFTSKGAVYLRIRDLTGQTDEQSHSNHQIYFAIQDSGIGINADAQKNLFMPFAQADSSINRKYGGTGLGLAICKRLIQAMGGTISINSKENEGSTFFFTLMMPTGSEVSEGSNDQHRQDGTLSHYLTNPISPLNVLIVDDNGINQKVASGFIEKLGSHTMKASSGADALTIMNTHKFDLILMDLQLPDMNGIEVTQKIRQMPVPDKANIPIVALSGNTDSDDIKSCYDAGMNDFAAKPITFEKIAEILTKVNNKDYLTLSATSQRNDDDNTGDDEDSFALAVKQFETMEETLAPPTLHKNAVTFEDSGLDENILKSLRSGLSTEQIEEILVGFYEVADNLIASIGENFVQGDTVNLYARAHELKGMAGNFGFSGVSQMCAIIEKSAKNNELASAKESVERLGDHYAVARRALSQWLSTPQ